MPVPAVRVLTSSVMTAIDYLVNLDYDLSVLILILTWMCSLYSLAVPVMHMAADDGISNIDLDDLPALVTDD